MDISILKYIPIFSELSETDLERISKVAMRQKYKKDNMLLIEEEVGSTMFIILNGRVKISRISDDGREIARGLVNYDAKESRQIMGQPSEMIESTLGYVDDAELIHRDKLVLL
jgi:glutamate 5-kinase